MAADLADAANVKGAWQTERLSFRFVRETDYDWFFNEIQSDPTNVALSSPCLLAPPRYKKPEDWYRERQGPSSLLEVVICLRESDDPAARVQRKDGGMGDQPDTATRRGEELERRIGFLSVGYGGYGSSPHARAGELGITLTAAYQDRGYGTEAVNWALDWAFRRGNLHSLGLSSIEYNTRAHKCYEKCGFRFEGRRRQCFWHDRKWYDLFFYSILENEWEQLRNTQEIAK